MNHPTRRNVMTGALALAAVGAVPRCPRKNACPDEPRTPEGRSLRDVDRTRFVDEFQGQTDDEKLTVAMQWQQETTVSRPSACCLGPTTSTSPASLTRG